MYKPINTFFSSGSKIESQRVQEAKEFLFTNYDNNYNMPPHITYSLTPLPEHNLKKLQIELDNYFKGFNRFTISMGSLHLDKKDKYFSLEVTGNLLIKMHADMTSLANNYREKHIRKKDKKRIEQGYYSQEQIEVIEKCGYARSLNLYRPHISIGKINIGDVDPLEVETILSEILGINDNREIVIDMINVFFRVDSEDQAKQKALWKKVYNLK